MSSLSKSFKLMKKNLKADIDALANREWLVQYKGHQIRIVNSSLVESVYIDDVLVVEKKHKSMFSQITPYAILKTTLPSTGEKMTVKIGGINAIVCSVKVGKTVILHDKTKVEMFPWQNKQPLYTFLQEAAVNSEDIRQITLPDEGFYYLDDDEPRFAMGLQMQFTEQSEIANLEAKSLIKKLHTLLAEPTNKKRQAVYEKVMDEDYLEYDRYFLEVFKDEKYNKEALKKEALWFIENATHRYAFIFGLEILRFTDYVEEMPQLKQIALHEDFTLFIGELMEKMPKANDEIFELAKKVEIWGRIFAVSFLKVETEAQKIWLTTDGYNGMFPELFAEKANVHHLLEVGEVSTEQFKVIGQMIVDLLNKGDVDNYDRASDTFLAYSRLAQNKVTNLEELFPIALIHDFFADSEDEDWEDRYGEDWKPIDRILITKETTKILEHRDWRPMVFEAIENDTELEVAIQIAEVTKMNITNKLLEKMREGSFEVALYDALLELNDLEIMKNIIKFLEKEVHIKTVTTKQIQCLYSAIDYLELYSGVGVSFLEKFIQMEEPSIQNRIVMTLDEWDEDKKWMTPTLRTKIEEFAKDRSDKELCQFAKRLLKGL